MFTKAQLQAARNLIAAPEHWTTGRFRRDAEGRAVKLFYEGFTEPPNCYCLVGALITQLPPQPLYEGLALVKHTFGRPVVELTQFNDKSTHAEVLAYLDEVISKTDH